MKSQVDREKMWNNISAQLACDQPDPGLRVLVLAAHPDDETIGASVLLARFPLCSVAFLTDGAPRDRHLWSAGVIGTREEYAGARREEALRALRCAGLSEGRMVWLGAVDQEAIFEISRLAERLKEAIRDSRPAVVVTHPYEGGHPDHDSAALVAKMAISSFEYDSRPVLLEMTSYHVRDGRCVTGEFLGSASPQLIFEASASDRERKRKMMDEYVSQRLVLENFAIDRELLRLAPEYDFSRPPHQGKLWYEHMGWPMTGARWCQLGSAAMAEFQEQSCG